MGLRVAGLKESPSKTMNFVSSYSMHSINAKLAKKFELFQEVLSQACSVTKLLSEIKLLFYGTIFRRKPKLYF